MTGISTILSFSGVELSWTFFDTWINGWEESLYGEDYGYDWNKPMINLALTYSGEVGLGKLTARSFWNDESVSFRVYESLGWANPVDNSSWGLGPCTPKNFFLASDTADDMVVCQKDWDIMAHPTDQLLAGLYVVSAATSVPSSRSIALTTSTTPA